MKRRPSENIIEHIEGENDSVVVFERHGERGLRFTSQDALIQGRMKLNQDFGFRSEYTKQQLAAAMCHPDPKSALCLGLGIGAVPRLWRAIWSHIHIDIVEINRAVIQAAMKHFALETSHNFRVHHGDASKAVHHPALHGFYDLVFIDCYDASSIPSVCRSASFIQGCVQCLSPTGVLLTNLLPDRLGAEEVQTHLKGQLYRPWSIPASQSSNMAVFGQVNHAIDLESALRRAQRADWAKTLPFEITKQLSQALPLNSVWPRLKRINHH